MGKHMKVHLPFEYNLKAQKKAAWDASVELKSRKLFHEYDSYTIDIVIIAAVLALIEGEGWGTNKTATKIPRFIARVQQTIEDACTRYGHDCAMTALCSRLSNYGVEYERKAENEKKSHHP